MFQSLYVTMSELVSFGIIFNLEMFLYIKFCTFQMIGLTTHSWFFWHNLVCLCWCLLLCDSSCNKLPVMSSTSHDIGIKKTIGLIGKSMSQIFLVGPCPAEPGLQAKKSQKMFKLACFEQFGSFPVLQVAQFAFNNPLKITPFQGDLKFATQISPLFNICK